MPKAEAAPSLRSPAQGGWKWPRLIPSALSRRSVWAWARVGSPAKGSLIRKGLLDHLVLEAWAVWSAYMNPAVGS